MYCFLVGFLKNSDLQNLFKSLEFYRRDMIMMMIWFKKIWFIPVYWVSKLALNLPITLVYIFDVIVSVN